MQRTVYVIDGMSICYRSFFALKNLSTQTGFPTNAIYGFISVLRKLFKMFSMEIAVVCFDTPAKTFRQEQYSDYKIQRPPMPDDLAVQIDFIKKIISLWGVKTLEKDGFEADDLIAAIAKKAIEEGYNVVAITSDKDMLQIVRNKKIVLYNIQKEKFIDETYIKNNFGVEPSRIPDFLALVGDTVDNIPGVKGIGPKAAFSLMKKFGNLDALLANLDEVPLRQRQLILNSREELQLSRQLATLRTDVDIDINVDDFRVEPANYKALAKIFEELEFNSLLKEIHPSYNRNNSVDLKLNVVSEEKFRRTVGENNYFAFLLAEDNAYLCSGGKLFHAAIHKITDLWENVSIKKIGYDLKTAKLLLQEKNIKLEGLHFDILLASFLIKPLMFQPALERISLEFLGEALPSDYMLQVNIIERLYFKLKGLLAENNFDYLFYKIEMPLLEVLVWMQTSPIKLDEREMDRALKKLRKESLNITKQIFSLAQTTFNLNSPREIATVLYEKLKLPVLKKTKTGFSTNEETLHKLLHYHPIVELILSYRKVNKLINTYIIPLKKEAERHRGKIFAKFSQVSAQTGRLTSYSPNLQNIPVKTDTGREIRRFFTSSFPEGFLLSSDYSQIELRVLAHLSQDAVLKQAFERDLDIHTFTASLLFNRSDITSSQRELAKKINFAVIYGMGPHGLKQELKLSFEEANEFIASYFRRYPGVKAYLDSLKNMAKEKGFVETIFGRRRYFPLLKKAKGAFYDSLLRQAINAPIQGSAAEIIKLAMIQIFKVFPQYSFRSRLIIQIHDELLFDVEKSEFNKVKDIVKEVMENVFSLSVPLKVNIRYGKNWGDLEEIREKEV